MNYRTQDVIVWDGLPHPDPKTRTARFSVQIKPAFWQRLVAHLTAAPSRTQWERWLTPCAVAALCSKDAPPDATADLASAIGGRFGQKSPAPEVIYVPSVAVERLHETLVASLESPFALCGYSSEKSQSPAWYHVVLVNGASLIFRPVRNQAGRFELEDCFFSRAAREHAEDAHANHDAPLSGRMRDFNTPGIDPAETVIPSDESPMYLSASPLPSDDFADDSFSAAGMYSTAPQDPICRAEVIRQLVQRHASLGASSHACMPMDRTDGPSAAIRHANPRVKFLNPNATKTTATHYEPAGWGNIEAYPADGVNAADVSMPGGASRLKNIDADLPTPPACCDSKPFSSFPELFDVLHRFNPGAVDGAKASKSAECCSAYRLAMTLGKCRVFGTAAQSITDTRLSPAIASAAATELEKRLCGWCSEARSLSARLSELSPAAAEDVCLGLIEARTDAWAAFVAIDECYTAALEAGDSHAEQMSATLDRIFDATESLDAALETAERCLAVPALHQLLANFRTALAEPFSETPPWWFQISASAVTSRRARAS